MNVHSTSVVVLSPDELRKLIVAAVEEAMAGAGVDRPRRIVTREQLAYEMQICSASVGRLMSEGMPTLSPGRSPKFDADACLAWFAERGQARQRPTDPQPQTACVRLISRSRTADH